eukprot:tig00000215_g18626.t2
MFTMPAGHGLGSGRGLFQAIAGAASVVRRFALAIAPEYSELLQVRRTSQRQRLQSCFKFVAPANANACIQAGERRLPPRLRSHGEQGLVFRRLQMLIRGGCSRTSLETAKLLLALDPDSDLMGVLQCIDYFALRAREYKFLLELAGAALFLPIALNSSAYALMRVARDGGAAPVDEPVLRRLFSHTLDPASPAPPRPLPRPSPRPLRQAVLMYPGAVRPLLENYNVKPTPGGWAALHRRPSSTTTSRPPASSSRP